MVQRFSLGVLTMGVVREGEIVLLKVLLEMLDVALDGIFIATMQGHCGFARTPYRIQLGCLLDGGNLLAGLCLRPTSLSGLSISYLVDHSGVSSRLKVF